MHPLSEGALDRSDGQVKTWVESWWGPQGKHWLGAPLAELTKEKMFKVHMVKGACLLAPPPAVMETAMELFNKDRIAQPWNPRVFVVPGLMTHCWQKSLSKDADLLFQAQDGDHCWSKDQHEPLIIDIVLPVAHIPQYRGPWVARGFDKSVKTAL